jgi:hypothetical protein
MTLINILKQKSRLSTLISYIINNMANIRGFIIINYNPWSIYKYYMRINCISHVEFYW